MIHTCPACGLQWECSCPADIISLHRRSCGGHHAEIACSEKCAYHLRALLAFLARHVR